MRDLASAVARARGKPHFPIVVLPANIEEMAREELDALADDTFPEVLGKITE